MSPILTIQRRMRELGRIRLGIQVPIEGKPGKRRPEKLTTFRLTSATKEYVEAAAEVYGGKVQAWESPRGPEWETVITSPHLDVIVPPGEVVDPWFELWSGGGCQRRCDGVTEQLSGQPCLCPADPKARQELAAKGEACKATTRLNVALPALPDLGVWRLETHSFYAAVELAGTADILRQATEQGVLIRARLRIDRRQVKRPNEPRKDFIVPVLELPDLRLDAMLAAGPITGARQLAAGPAGRPALPPGPQLPERSDFRPAVAPPEAETADFVAIPDTDSGDPEPEAPGPSEAGSDLAARLRDLAARSGLAGAPTAPQKARLQTAFASLGGEAIQGGIAAVFGHPRFESAAEAQAVVTLADSLGDPEFRAAWAGLAG